MIATQAEAAERLGEYLLNCQTAVSDFEAETWRDTFDLACEQYRRRYHPKAERLQVNCLPGRQVEIWACSPFVSKSTGRRFANSHRVWPLVGAE